MNKESKITDKSPMDEGQTEIIQIPTEKVPKPEAPVRNVKEDNEVKPAIEANTAQVSNSVPAALEEPEAEDLPKQIDLTLSPFQVENMEQDLGALQKDVSLFRYKKGWLVRFHTRENLLSEIGVRDSDFIRFSQFEQMKNDVTKKDLVSRLESVLVQLEK